MIQAPIEILGPAIKRLRHEHQEPRKEEQEQEGHADNDAKPGPVIVGCEAIHALNLCGKIGSHKRHWEEEDGELGKQRCGAG